MECLRCSPYEFKVENVTDSRLSHKVVASAKEAISAVWAKNVGRPERFKLVFCSHITDPFTEETSSALSVYDPEGDTFTFALDTIKEECNALKGMPVTDKVLLLAAHEAYHKVQSTQGNQLPPAFNRSGNLSKDYRLDPYEDIAWRESTDLSKRIHPNVSGYICVNPTQRYPLPTISSY